MLFDGHGEGAAALTHEHVPKWLVPMLLRGDARRALRDFDAALPFPGGSTVTGVVLEGRSMQVVNLGDSRTAVLCAATGQLLCLTEDHSPTRADERRRIEAAGGFVANGRVGGTLAMSRSLGDRELKSPLPLVSAEATVQRLPVDRPMFAFLMSDGMWTGAPFDAVLRALAAVAVAAQRPPTVAQLESMGAALVDAFGDGSDDATTAVVYVD